MGMTPLRSLRFANLDVHVFASEREAGRAAAALAARLLTQVHRGGRRANVLFSTGTSQFELVAGLSERDDIYWGGIIGFHLDEYRGIDAEHPASFRYWLRQRVVEPFGPQAFHFIEGDAADSGTECGRYADLLRRNPIDLAFVGIGENGHIAFNDPPVADFSDPELVKVVETDDACRRQQVNEGWFDEMGAVPKEALTLTVPAIMAAGSIISLVPGARKATALRDALEGPVSTVCPASALRNHRHASVFTDGEGTALIGL